MLVNPPVIVEVAATAAYFGGCFFILRYLKRLNKKYGIDVCEVGFKMENGPRCPCCCQIMRARPRHSVGRIPIEERENASIIELKRVLGLKTRD